MSRDEGSPDHERREAARRAREARERAQGFPPGVAVRVDETGDEVWEFDDAPDSVPGFFFARDLGPLGV